MSKMPLVSVIVPLYNYQKFIVDCMASIKQQDYENYELIIVDDCSTDSSYEVAKSFEDVRTTVIKLDRNRGYSRAKNEGIILSQGDLITCLDADDLLTKDSLSCRVSAILKKGIPFVHAKAFNIRGNISLDKCYKMTHQKAKRPRVHAQTVMVERWVYKKFGLYEEKLRSKSDKEMWWRLFGKNDSCKFKIDKLFINNFVAYYRKHGASMMDKRSRNFTLQKKLLKQLDKAYQKRQSGITVDNTRFLES